MLDCRVPVRKYVLIAKPKRWGQKSERVVVQSPMSISNTASEVPVRRYNGEEQNFVCFIPRSDIEKDSSDAYEKSQVSRDTSSVNVHGVALFDSSPSDDFSYKYGDKFWILIAVETNGYEECVPVINLRTFESGIIQINQVCWYPKIRGPGQELWTPGGKTRQQKLHGSKRYVYWSFFICQHMDGRPSTTKTVHISTKDAPLTGQSLLSIQESRALFERQLRYILEGPESVAVSPSTAPPSYLVGSNISLLPTLPTSPDVEHAQRENKGKKKVAESQRTASTSKNADLWRRVVTIAVEGQRKSKWPFMLRNSIVHPQLPSRPSIDLESDFDEEDDDSSLCRTSQFNTRDSSASVDARNEKLPLEELDDLDAEEFFGATFLFDPAKGDCREEPFISLTNSATINDPAAAIRKKYSENKPEHNPLLDGHCDRNDPRCLYTTIFATRHYHPPHEKCRRAISEFSNHSTHPYYHPTAHEHCISRTGLYPDIAGDCLLANSLLYPNHTCCKWEPSDLDAIPFTKEDELRNIKETIEGRIKEAEARRKRIKLNDTRSLCEFKVMLGEHLGSEELVALGPSGREFKAILDAGNWDAEVGNLHDIEPNSEDEDEDKMWNEWGRDLVIEIPSAKSAYIEC
ncbi:uncharacterized protein PAC_08336 [Phialocephala subalpina]|uniref:Uncharacterized protein n=1 Tax=Phialocephala subalpina TaxID=576137 RepID=A0A1L7X098_9HELO|nr:uncharacterized protein PAC_08336 [Phialocephala subalpina]